jgi:tetratricopeptide (TPR) repeat protein
MQYAVRCVGLIVLAVSSLATSSLTAQRLGGPGTGTSSLGTGTGDMPSQPTQPTNPGQYPDTQMPIFLSGRVLMDDGTAPATSIPIQRICSGTPRTVAFTNARGQFNFQWGSPTGFVPDATEAAAGNGMRTPGDMSTNDLRGSQIGDSMGREMLGCALVANAPGFRSERLNLSGHRATDNPDLGTIVLHRIVDVEGTSVSATSLNAPKDARKAWEKGVQFLHKSKLADAEKELEKAVEIYPKYANAWLDLGRARIQQQAEGSARDAFLKAIDADDKLVEPYLELGEMAAHAQEWPNAARYLDRALQLDPVDYPRLWFEDAVADYNVQNFDRAEKNAREALKLPPADRDPHANQLLGLILLNKQDYAGAGKALREYVQLSPDAKDLDQVKAQLEQIDSHLAATKP